ncbi:MAG: hypothetical protein LBB66_02890, partial [Desulfovibrio sp.]|nr:hypothetical protein [Desulfovibrio sp.]
MPVHNGHHITPEGLELVLGIGAPGPGESKADYTLYQAAEVYLTRYKVAPLVCVNVFDPAAHVVTSEDVVADETLTEGVPYWSPSNSPLNCDGIVHAGSELHLTPLEAAYLNGQ